MILYLAKLNIPWALLNVLFLFSPSCILKTSISLLSHLWVGIKCIVWFLSWVCEEKCWTTYDAVIWLPFPNSLLSVNVSPQDSRSCESMEAYWWYAPSRVKRYHSCVLHHPIKLYSAIYPRLRLVCTMLNFYWMTLSVIRGYTAQDNTEWVHWMSAVFHGECRISLMKKKAIIQYYFWYIIWSLFCVKKCKKNKKFCLQRRITGLPIVNLLVHHPYIILTCTHHSCFLTLVTACHTPWIMLAVLNSCFIPYACNIF